MAFLAGKVHERFLKDSEVYVLGSMEVGVLVSEKVAVLIGSGKVGLLASNTCIVFSTRKPLAIGSAYCGVALLVGANAPLLVGYLKSNKAFVRKAHVQRLCASEATLSSLCAIDELEVSERTVFTDPHTYVKKVISIGDVSYSYRLCD